MSTRAETYLAEVESRTQLAPHLVRVSLGGDGLAAFATTGVPDEWVGLVVPGQFQSRYYTVRSWDGTRLTLDVVVHDEGLVTEWASGDCVGDTVTLTEPKGSFALPEGAHWVLLVGDLTALPAMARIAETVTDLPLRVWAEVADDLPGYLPDGTDVTWLTPPAEGRSALAEAVERIDWPAGAGYFWMAGESAQMRAVRRHLMRERGLPSTAYDVMGYWREVERRQPRVVDRPVDPGPIWRAGKARGLGDDQIWKRYDAAREQS